MDGLAIYIHIPFCSRKCSYCDFNTYSGLGALVPPYVEAICKDIQQFTQAPVDRPVLSVFFGGGTPTYLNAGQIESILDSVRTKFKLDSRAEISSEANPGSADASLFAEMKAAGFNRLSIGVQSFDDRLLKAIDREHTADEAIHAVRAAREADFTNVSIDLMFGLPGQTIEDWSDTLERAISLNLNHLSVYALTLEPGTRFERLRAGGKLDLPGEDAELEMYLLAEKRLSAAGFEHYEISNYAKPGCRARHNLVYWHNGEYLGFGAGAVSYLDGCRWTSEKNPARYIERVNRHADTTFESERLDPIASLGETLMLGLRLREGVELSSLRERFRIDPAVQFAAGIQKMTERGLLCLANDRLRLTDRGRLLSNEVFMEFVA